MFSAIASVLELVVQPCYDLTGNWWAAILLFTIIMKVVLMPMSLWCQKNGIVMVQLMPELNRIKIKYFGDQEAIGEKQSALYKERGYHPMLTLVPLAIQVIILFGLVEVIRNIVNSGSPGTEFLGMQPTIDGGLSWLMPLLAGLSAVVLGYAQNRINPLQKEQSKAEKNTTNGLSIGLSLVLGVFVSAGMCFYWICSNLTSIVVQALCNVIIDPKKHIDYEDLELSRQEIDNLNKLDGGKKRKWYQRDPLGKREKADYKAFFNVVGKHIVFYSEGSGFFKYFQGAIDYILRYSDANIHYVTNDPNDQIFGIAERQPRIKPYYIGQKRAITLMMKMDADIVVTTLEDLENYYIKRSYVRDDIEYVFMFHHMTSTHLTPSKNAYDHYDTLLCVGPHQVNEIRRMESLYQLPKKNLVECGYDLLDREIADYQELQANQQNDPHEATPVVLIATSWQEDNILDSCIDDMLESLLPGDWNIVVRPHPEYVKRYRARWDALVSRYANVHEPKLRFEGDFSSNSTIFTSSVLITDWSSISCEFSFSTGKPCVFVDTLMKIGNADWEELKIDPTDITLRSRIGASFDPKDLDGVYDAVDDMVRNSDLWQKQIYSVRDELIFNLGKGAETAGSYLVDRMLELQDAKLEGEE